MFLTALPSFHSIKKDIKDFYIIMDNYVFGALFISGAQPAETRCRVARLS